jgi:protein-S-isoprenylcysteine O-methyltransferase Ste14
VRLTGTALGLALRSLLWTVLLPGLLAGYVPWRYFGLRQVVLDPARPLHWAGLLAIGTGTILLAMCIVEFARRGRGTLSPVDPPRLLVIQGLYRHVRNPMYLSVSLVLLGEAALTMSRGLLLYWLVWFLGANIFVRFYEEPVLIGQIGPAYEEYVARVGRWIPRLRP